MTTLRPTALLTLQRDQFNRLLAQVPGLRDRLEAEHTARNQRTAVPFPPRQ